MVTMLCSRGDLFRFLLITVLLFLLSMASRADDKAARDRAAKAALALAAASKEPATAAAPEPRPAVRCYPGGCKAAMDDGKPLVVYVSCEAKPVEGAIVAHCSAETFGETTGPAIVVGYPRGDRLFVESTLKGDAKPDEVLRAVKEAAKKTTPPPKQMPPAAAVDSWRISADVCPCGPGCKCAPCECGGHAQQKHHTITPSVINPPQTLISGGDGLAEVNAKRAAKGLRPFAHDAGLAAAAKACAEFRAAHLMFGHTDSDFGFLAKGVPCAATGCAAYPPRYGWMSCCTYDAFERAGAWWAMGRDGKRYMHLYVGYVAAAPVEMPPATSGVVTYREVIHPDTTGRLCRWNVPSDARLPWQFVGYVQSASPVQPGWEMTPFIAPYYASYCPPGRA